MAEVKRHVVAAEEDGMRLDRWFKVHFPQVTFAYLNKLTRTGQVRIGPGRCKTNVRLVQGQEIRVPPLAFDTRPAAASQLGAWGRANKPARPPPPRIPAPPMRPRGT